MPAARAQYELLVTRYQAQAEQLSALSGLYWTHYYDTAPDAKDRAGEVLTQMRSLLRSLDNKVIQAQPGSMTRDQWLDWVNAQGDQLTHGGPLLKR